jgi:hypothetical protein
MTGIGQRQPRRPPGDTRANPNAGVDPAFKRDVPSPIAGLPSIRLLAQLDVRAAAYGGGMAYSFVGKSADQIIKDLEANMPQGEIGGGAYEIAAAAIQAPVARENRRLQFRLTVISLCVAVASLAVAVVALATR